MGSRWGRVLLAAALKEVEIVDLTVWALLPLIDGSGSPSKVLRAVRKAHLCKSPCLMVLLDCGTSCPRAVSREQASKLGEHGKPEVLS